MHAPTPDPCPYLPLPERLFTHDDMHSLGGDRGPEFYHTALHYAQSLWLSGYPAKALLLISRALACRLPEVSLKHPVKPYLAVAWLLQNRASHHFVGNPRRHFQHLASRMVQPHRDLRTWRAWACWYLTKELLAEAEFPADAQQIHQEGIIEPRYQDIVEHLQKLSPRDDLDAWEEARIMVAEWGGKLAESPLSGTVVFTEIEANQLPMVRQLAEEIWPRVYGELIGQEQIHYMLKKMYDPAVMAESMQNQGVRFILISQTNAEVPVGFLSWEPQPEEKGAFLHKLYLRPEVHGRGIGAQALAWVEQQATQIGLQSLQLRVNRQNHPAIRAYRRQGFTFEDTLCSEIGEGFVMDDYLMKKILNPG